MPATATSNNFCRIRGTLESTVIPSPTLTQINVGDMVWVNAGVGAVAGSFTWTTDLPTTQPLFKAVFLGISNDQKLATDPGTQNINVITNSIFRMPCAALGSAQHIGTFIGPAKDSGNNLHNQNVAIVSGATLSIGQLVEEAPVGATSVVVKINGTEARGF